MATEDEARGERERVALERERLELEEAQARKAERERQGQQGSSTFGSKILAALRTPQRLHESLHQITSTYSPLILLLPIALLWFDFFTGFNGICIKGNLGTECQFFSWDLIKFIFGFFISATYIAIIGIFIIVRGIPSLRGLIYYSLLSLVFFAALVLGGPTPMVLLHLAFAGFVYVYVLKGFEKEQEVTQSHWVFLALFALDMFFFPALYGLNLYTSNYPILQVISSRLLVPIWFFYLLTFVREGFGKGLISTIILLFYVGYLGIYMYPYVQTQLAEIPQEQKQDFINAPIKAMKNWWLGFKTYAESRLDYATGGLYRSQVEKNQFEPLGVFFDRVRAAQPKFYTDEDVTLWAVIKSRTLSDPVLINFTCFRWKQSTLGKERIKAKVEGDKGLNERYDIVIPKTPFTVYTLEEKDAECTFTQDALNPKLQAGTNEITLLATYNFATNAYQKAYFIDRDRYRAMIRENLDPLKEFGITDRTPSAVYTNGPVEIAVSLPVSSQSPVIPVTDESGVLPFLGIMLKNRDKITDKQGKPIGQWEGKIRRINELVVVLPKGITIESDGKNCRPVEFEKIENTENFCESSCLDVVFFPCLQKCKSLQEQSSEQLNCIQDCSKNKENSDSINKCKEDCSSVFKLESGDLGYEGYKLNVEELYKRTKDEYKDLESGRNTIFGCRIKPTKDILENAPITIRFIRMRVRYDYLIQKTFNVLVEQAPATISRDVDSIIDKYATAEGVDSNLIKAIAFVETGVRHCKYGATSCKKEDVIVSFDGSSVGLMQINVRDSPGNKWVTDATPYCESGKTVYDIDCNIRLGIKVLKDKHNDFKAGPPKNLEKYCPKDHAYYNVYASYRDWDAAIRGYNGWSCPKPTYRCDEACVNRILNYVAHVRQAERDIINGIIDSKIQERLKSVEQYIPKTEIETNKPLPPPNAQAVDTRGVRKSITISWDKSPTPNVRYRVYRYLNSSVERGEYYVQDFYDVDGLSYIDKNVEDGIEYIYAVAAFNENGESNYKYTRTVRSINDELQL